MNDKKERVYSEEDLCEYTILQKIDELEKQLKNIKNEFNDLYETKENANAIHVKFRQSDAKINNRIDGLYNITPTDVGVKDNKLGLLHDTTWLTNQDAINLDGFTYDEATKTLKASGGGGETIHLYLVLINDENDNFCYIASSATDYGRDRIFVLHFGKDKTYSDLHKVGKSYAVLGYCYIGEQMCPTCELSIIDLAHYPFQIDLFNPATKKDEQLIKGEEVGATIFKLL